jgi:hypothetical protein
MEFGGFTAEFFDFCGRGVGLQQRVIDQPGDFPGAAAIRMQAEPRCAGHEHAANLFRTAVEAEAVTPAPRRRHRSGRGELLQDDVDDASNIGH